MNGTSIIMVWLLKNSWISPHHKAACAVSPLGIERVPTSLSLSLMSLIISSWVIGRFLLSNFFITYVVSSTNRTIKMLNKAKPTAIDDYTFKSVDSGLAWVLNLSTIISEYEYAKQKLMMIEIVTYCLLKRWPKIRIGTSRNGTLIVWISWLIVLS